MTQALLNNLIKNPNDLSEKMTGLKSNNQNNDFQRLFEKQNALNDKKTNTNNYDSKSETSEQKQNIENKNNDDNSQSSTVVQDIKQIIAFLTNNEQVKNDNTSSEEDGEITEEFVGTDTEITENSSDSNKENIDIDIIIPTTEDSTESSNNEGAEKTENSMNTTENTQEIYITNPDTSSFIQTQQNIQTNSAKNDNSKINEAENNEMSSEKELNVTLNGKDLDSILENFNLNSDSSADETTVQNLQQEPENIETKKLEEILDEEQIKELNIESVESETQFDDSGSDLMQNQTPEEQGLKAMLQTDIDFADIKPELLKQNTTQAIQKSISPSEINSEKILEQITKQMEGMHNSSKVNIVLNPESLGKVSVQIINTKEGLSAQFTVATQEARNLIMKGLDGLKDSLISQGVSIDNVTVKLNDSQESEYNADWTEQEGSRGGNKEQNQHKKQDEQRHFEQMMSFIENENG